MIERKKFEAKNKDEALKQALDYFKTDIDNLIIDEEYISGKLFKSSKCILNVISYNDIVNYLRKYFKDLSEKMNIPYQQEVRFQDDVIQVMIVSPEYNQNLIGKNGKTLDSLQSIVRQSLLVQTGLPIKINIDISNYKQKKVNRLENSARKIAKEVINTKEDIALDPMNSYERRIIHTMIQEMDHVTTESIGEGKERHIIIKYVP